MRNINPNQKESASQCRMILEALQRGETITPLDALRRFGCFRLGARIYDLKDKGYEIEAAWGGDGRKKYRTYRMKMQ